MNPVDKFARLGFTALLGVVLGVVLFECVFESGDHVHDLASHSHFLVVVVCNQKKGTSAEKLLKRNFFDLFVGS